jgi:hypothetical protein
MGFRFRRSIKILPGIRLNVGKRGVSTSIGVRGAHITVGHGQVRETVGLPGTGISYTHVESSKAQEQPAASAEAPASTEPSAARGWAWIAVLLLLVVLVGWLLASCGGGGGAGSLQSAKAPSLPIFVAGTTLKATDSSGNTWTATYSNTAGGATTFNGQVAYEASYSFTVSMNGAVVDGESGTEFALMDPYSPLGLVISMSSLPGRISPGSITSYNPLPSTLMAGASGSLSSGIFGSSGYTYSEAYSVTPDSSGALFLNIHLDFPDFGLFHGENSLTGLYSGTSTMTYSVTSSGAATLAKIQVTINGTTLTFQ